MGYGRRRGRGLEVDCDFWSGLEADPGDPPGRPYGSAAFGDDLEADHDLEAGRRRCMQRRYV